MNDDVNGAPQTAANTDDDSHDEPVIEVVNDPEDDGTPEGDAESENVEDAVEGDEAARTEQPREGLDLPRGRRTKRRRSGWRARVGAIAVATTLVLSAGLTAWLYFFQFRPDQQSDTAAAQVALNAATAGTTALLTYSPESLDKDFADAKSHLTGEFLDYYTQFTQNIVTPAAKQKQVKTSATVVQSAMSEMHPDSAVALVFVNQTTLSKENPDGAFAASAVKVGLTKINGNWLISSFDPV
jgi:Mce-associated membrane protein